MKNDLADYCAVTLVQDGWSMVSNDPIIAHSIHNGSKLYLISAVDAGSHSKTAEHCTQAVKDVIKIAKETFNKDVSVRLFQSFICNNNFKNVFKIEDFYNNLVRANFQKKIQNLI